MINNYLLIKIIVLASAYFIAGKLSFLISVNSEIVTIVIFASEGIALAAILLFGRKLWPGVLIGQFVLGYSTGLGTIPSLLISISNSMEVIIAFNLFKFFNLDRSLYRIKDTLGLTALIVIILQPFSSLIGNNVLLSFGIIEHSTYTSSLFSWWFGNSMGQILIAPFIIYFYNNYKQTNVIDFIICSIFFFCLSYLLIIYFDIKYLALLISATLPFVIYLSSKRDLHYVTFSVIIIAVIALYSTHLNVGVFSRNDTIENIISLNFYILSLMMIALFIGVLFYEKKIALEQLNKMALYDPLTNLPNRYLLHERIQQAVIMSKRRNGKVAICFIDVDRFKEVNDSLGHDAGDIVLKEIATRINNNIREEDSLLRLGGDEFVLIITNITNKSNISPLLNKISKEVNKPIKIGKNAATISLSIGVSLYPHDTESTSELISYADKAMYEAKEKGRNQFIFYQFSA